MKINARICLSAMASAAGRSCGSGAGRDVGVADAELAASVVAGTPVYGSTATDRSNTAGGAFVGD